MDWGYVVVVLFVAGTIYSFIQLGVLSGGRAPRTAYFEYSSRLRLRRYSS